MLSMQWLVYKSNRDQGASSLAIPVPRKPKSGHMTAAAVDLAVGPVIHLEFKMFKKFQNETKVLTEVESR